MLLNTYKYYSNNEKTLKFLLPVSKMEDIKYNHKIKHIVNIKLTLQNYLTWVCYISLVDMLAGFPLVNRIPKRINVRDWVYFV